MDSEGIFRVANIGDSGFMVIRNNEILIQSAEHQHQFNYPYQLGIGIDGKPYGTDSPEDAQIYTIELERGDIVVMATDGLFDNVWPKQIVSYFEGTSINPKLNAKELATFAYQESQKDDNFVPFFHRAKKEKKNFASYRGGKEDDISVIVSVVD